VGTIGTGRVARKIGQFIDRHVNFKRVAAIVSKPNVMSELLGQGVGVFVQVHVQPREQFKKSVVPAYFFSKKRIDNKYEYIVENTLKQQMNTY
jgi:hypothetical protein